MTDGTGGDEGRSALDEICREGARRMLAAALEAEADAYITALGGERDDRGHRLVNRNGHARRRKITTVAGAVEIRAPRVDDRRVDPDSGVKATFKSSIVPRWCRKSPKVTEVLPLLYLHGLSTGDFAPALEGFSKSKSSRAHGAGRRAKRARPAWRRASVAATSTANSRCKKAVWEALSLAARSSSAAGPRPPPPRRR